jgi:hypothetical protein
VDLRCPNKKHGVVLVPSSNEDAVVEIQCRSRWCGAMPGVIVLHRFSVSTGDLVETRKYRSPPIGG